MVERLVMEKYKDSYVHSKSSSEAIGYLAGFLHCDVGRSHITFFKEWLSDPTWIVTGGDYSHVEKHGNKVTVEFELDHFEEVPNAPIFELTVEQMGYILDRWDEAIKKQPNKIIITKDDTGKITVDFED